MHGEWQRRWRDFEAGTHGDIFDLHQRERGGGFAEAIAWVAGHLGLPVPGAVEQGQKRRSTFSGWMPWMLPRASNAAPRL
jgi:hypothetical protein